ncbi:MULTISPECIES: hypothetical protein [Acinetobacter]|uniref:hypothetical protein n=1 Tax=Acinetobacter TaxID=469 RepID=UPI00054D9C56|nr:hypothetical protein [Acinetobacter sp. HR7]
MNTHIQMQDWHKIRSVVADAQRAAMHCSISTISPNGFPTSSPIGTLFLDEQNPAGFFFDRYCTSLEQNLPHTTKACIQAVNSSRTFWLRSLIKGKFNTYPGVRLYAEIGELRPATQAELDLIDRRIKPLKWTRGSRLIWSEFTHVREIQIHRFKWVEYPKMMPNN